MAFGALIARSAARGGVALDVLHKQQAKEAGPTRTDSESYPTASYAGELRRFGPSTLRKCAFFGCPVHLIMEKGFNIKSSGQFCSSIFTNGLDYYSTWALARY